jgi:hypothetical protein
MLTVNSDEHPLMNRFHEPGDEKRDRAINRICGLAVMQIGG